MDVQNKNLFGRMTTLQCYSFTLTLDIQYSIKSTGLHQVLEENND